MSPSSRKSRYVATATREGKRWLIHVPELDRVTEDRVAHGYVTQARRVDQIELMAREMIAVTLEVPLDEVEVEVVIEVTAT